MDVNTTFLWDTVPYDSARKCYTTPVRLLKRDIRLIGEYGLVEHWTKCRTATAVTDLLHVSDSPYPECFHWRHCGASKTSAQTLRSVVYSNSCGIVLFVWGVRLAGHLRKDSYTLAPHRSMFRHQNRSRFPVILMLFPLQDQ